VIGAQPQPDALLAAIAGGTRVIDLGQPLHPRVPHSPNQPGFQYALTRRHGDIIRADGASAATDLLITGGHTGTHVDALAHVSQDGKLHGGVEAAAVQSNQGFAAHGIDTLSPLVVRGLLFDIPATLGVQRLEPEQPVTPEDLSRAADRAGFELRAGDAALIRTGWGQHWDDSDAFVSAGRGAPGPTEAAARWLADRGIAITGSDTTAYEQITAAVGHGLLPVHRVLLVEAGIPIIEMLNLEPLSASGISEFVFVLAPLRIVGATGSPVRPLAVTSA
jgi:kynurenine formamidase